MEDEKEIRDDKISQIIAELKSYAAILSDYMDAHEDIDEFLHASLIISKMSENIDNLGELFEQ